MTATGTVTCRLALATFVNGGSGAAMSGESVVRACNATSSLARSLYAAADRSRRAGAPARSSAAGREERRVLARPEVGPWRRLDGRSTALRAGTDRARGHRARTLAGGVATDP